TCRSDRLSMERGFWAVGRGSYCIGLLLGTNETDATAALCGVGVSQAASTLDPGIRVFKDNLDCGVSKHFGQLSWSSCRQRNNIDGSHTSAMACRYRPLQPNYSKSHAHRYCK